MRRFPIDPDYIIFALLVAPLPVIASLEVASWVRLLLLLPVVLLQALFVWNGLRRGKPRPSPPTRSATRVEGWASKPPAPPRSPPLERVRQVVRLPYERLCGRRFPARSRRA
ncbi:MAG: hypothetical protein H0Z37_11690 [Firmicutes bacterium]|nr:hypothetical protein [Bacillota bacterium]